MKISAPLSAFIIISILALAFLVGGIVVSNYTPVGPNTVVFKDGGFHPSRIAIQVGETVTFINKGSFSFWPASDNHPQHTLYTEFDAGHPLEKNESWTFTFEKEGVWWYHDHLRPYYNGKVVVGNADESKSCLDELEGASIEDKQSCWERELANELKEHGTTASFELFTELYNTDKDFTTIGCHWMAHKIGEVEYSEFLTHKDLSRLEFPPETSYCGYGYYHGFLEHYLRDDPDYDAANQFCQTLITRLEDRIPRIRLNCYHAVGHGFVPEPDDVEVWGDPRKMVAPALDACERMSRDDERHECYQGTFNVIGDWMWNNQFGLYYPEDKPLALCASFDDHEKKSACYYEVSMRLNPSVDNNIVRAYNKYISHIPDEAIAGMVLSSVAASALGQDILNNDFSRFVYECRQIPEFLQTDCMKGLSAAFMAAGEPENEYKKAIDFCNLDILSEEERDICYWNIVRTFEAVYLKDKMEKVCALIAAPYQKYCTYE
ncbi:MAG: hypothetical protein ACJKTH_03840 [Patescibacteria group bacterium UBA2163]